MKTSIPEKISEEPRIKRAPLLTPRETAEFLGVSVRTIRRWTRDNIIPVVRFGRVPRYDAEKIVEAVSG